MLITVIINHFAPKKGNIKKTGSVLNVVTLEHNLILTHIYYYITVLLNDLYNVRKEVCRCKYVL